MKAKGIETRPYPQNWYDARSLRITDTDTPEEIARKEFDISIVVNRKPYFMKYVYDDVKREYNTFVEKANNNSLCRFGIPFDELDELVKAGDGTPKQQEFVENYYHWMPVSIGDCVVNRICRRVEKEFGREYNSRAQFDSKLLMAGVATNKKTCASLLYLYKQYERDNSQLMTDANKEGLSADMINNRRDVLIGYYREMCSQICSDEVELCDSLVKMCYQTNGGKQFAWDICGGQIIKNLLNNSDGKLHYPVRDRNGDIEFKGDKYRMVAMNYTGVTD